MKNLSRSPPALATISSLYGVCGFQDEAYPQPGRIWDYAELDLGEVPGALQGRNGLLNLASGIRFAGFHLHQRPECVYRDFGIRDKFDTGDLLSIVRHVRALLPGERKGGKGHQREEPATRPEKGNRCPEQPDSRMLADYSRRHDRVLMPCFLREMSLAGDLSCCAGSREQQRTVAFIATYEMRLIAAT